MSVPAKAHLLYRWSPRSRVVYGYCAQSRAAVMRPRCPKLLEKASKHLHKAAVSTAKGVCQATKKTTVIWPIKLLLTLLDILAMPYAKMKGKDLNFPLLWKAGTMLLIADVWIWIIIADIGKRFINTHAFANNILALAQVIIPGGIAFGALSLILGGIRLYQGKSFLNKYGGELEPLPAFENGAVFRIGDIKLSIRDMHTNVGVFGGIGTGKTVSVMVPLMRQFFQQLNHDTDDPKDDLQKVGALILDEKGDFIDSTIMEMMLAGRPIEDLVLIDPDLDLIRYNPLDPSQSADENAQKLAKVQKIIGGDGGKDNKYWEDTSRDTIKYFLQLLEVYKPKEKIGLDDVARFMRDDQLATTLCDEVEATIESKKTNHEISDETYGIIYDAISATRNQWIHLSQNTKSILKTTINQMLSSLASNPRLQRTFCRDTNFSFRDLANKGKIVLFRGSSLDKATVRLICVCLKIDFQTWQKRRNGSAAAAFGMNTTRTVLFICDEYQEFVTCGDEGDQTFYGVSRSAKTCAIIATQSLNSLKSAIKNPEQTNTLVQNITTWVFLRTTDKDTMELGSTWAGESKQEDFSVSQTTGGLIDIASNLSSGGGKDNTVNISRKLEKNFRLDDFSRLITVTKEKSRKGPWYSQAIVYHYHDTDEDAQSRCYKTNIPHYYYTEEQRKRATTNVLHLDWLLYDRNWQRKIFTRGLTLIAAKRAEESKEKERYENYQKTQNQPPPPDPHAERRQRMFEQAKTRITTDTALITASPPGAALPGTPCPPPKLTAETIEELKTQKMELTTLLHNTGNEQERETLRERIEKINYQITNWTLTEMTRRQNLPEATREVLEAEANPFDAAVCTPEPDDLPQETDAQEHGDDFEEDDSDFEEDDSDILEDDSDFERDNDGFEPDSDDSEDDSDEPDVEPETETETLQQASSSTAANKNAPESEAAAETANYLL